MNKVEKELLLQRDKSKAAFLQKFFKTGKGQYGAGDIFLGITVPEQREIAKKLLNLPLTEIQESIKNPIHECRLTSLIILVSKYKKGTLQEKEAIYTFYMKNINFVNNWDLVDASARDIVGNYLLNRDRSILYKLAHSKNIWERRIAIVATYEFIRNREYDETFKIAEILLHDQEDLVQKAVGWMLREAGNRDQKSEEMFLQKHFKTMPRTMLRYAIEKFEQSKRQYYMAKTE